VRLGGWEPGATDDERAGAVARLARRQTQERNAQKNAGCQGSASSLILPRASLFVAVSTLHCLRISQLATSFCSTFLPQYGVRMRQALASATQSRLTTTQVHAKHGTIPHGFARGLTRICA
jgi:hypothetical protein